MKKKIVCPLFVLSMLFAFPVTFALAGDCGDGKDNDSDNMCDYEGCTIGAASLPADSSCAGDADGFENATPVDDAGGEVTTDLSFSIHNPLDSDIDTLPEFINKVVEIFLMVGTPIIALMIIYSGFLFVIARGNPEAIEKAKKALGYTLLGATILLGAFVISTAIQDTILKISEESD